MKTLLAVVAFSVCTVAAQAAPAQGNAGTPVKAQTVAKASHEARKEARKACKAEGKSGKDLKSCVKEKLKA